jgi:hypothetical protein
MALGSTQPPTEMSARNLPVGKGWPALKAGHLATICEPTVYKMWEPRRLTNLWSSTACYRDSFTFFFLPSTCKGYGLDDQGIEVLYITVYLATLSTYR